jgi:hypothetical protein
MPEPTSGEIRARALQVIDHEKRLDRVRKEGAEWTQLVAAVKDYREAVRWTFVHDEGASFWKVDAQDDEQAEASLEEVLAARERLSALYNSRLVLAAIVRLVEEELDGSEFEPGVDCDRITSYEPYGRPSSGICQAVGRATLGGEYGVLETWELLAISRASGNHYQDEALADNFETMRRLRTREQVLRPVLARRGLPPSPGARVLAAGGR